MNKLAIVFISFFFSCSSSSDGGTGNDTSNDNETYDCAKDTRDQSYEVGMTNTGDSSYTYKLLSSVPGPPDRGLNTWRLEISNSTGDALDEAFQLDISPFMPDHGHGSNTSPTITRDASGLFTVEDIDLFMPGFWEIRVRVKNDEDQVLDTVLFNFCIRG